jgi:hypothetical protein
MVQIKAHHARDFGRVLRAIRWSGRTWLPEAVLNCADLRTLNKMMDLAGLTDRHGSLTPSVHEFLQKQRWIPENHCAMHVLKTLLRELCLLDSGNSSFPVIVVQPEAGLGPTNAS